jgi:membrane-bound metal-dependent hydrolase YbcI (DUF457 family)
VAPTGAHGIIGLALTRTTRNPHIRVGLVLGSIFPDLDLTFGMILALLGWIDTPNAVHRTFSHSLLVVIILAAFGAVLVLQGPSINHKQVGWLLVGMVVGVLAHILMDMLLWTPLPIFWPLDLDVGPIFLGDDSSPGPTKDQPPIALLPGHILFLMFIGLIEFWGVYTREVNPNKHYWLVVALIGLPVALIPVIAVFFFSSNDFAPFFDLWSYLIAIPLMFLFPLFRKDSIGFFWDIRIKNGEILP